MAHGWTVNHVKFFEMLDQVPRIKHCWDHTERVIKLETFEAELGVMSPGECHMAQFFAAVWFHDNEKYGFDLIDAAASIDEEHRILIMNWIKDPFWP